MKWRLPSVRPAGVSFKQAQKVDIETQPEALGTGNIKHFQKPYTEGSMAFTRYPG